MTRKAVLLVPLLSSTLLCAFAFSANAQSTTPTEDPFKPVFVVAARDTYTDHMAHAARNAVARRGRSGEALVLAELKSHQLLDISQRIHREEHHCGGYFAFDTQAEAEAFIRNGASADAIAAAVSYTVDNQATVGAWLPQVQEANIRGTISHLSGNYRNRYYTTTTGKSAAEWIRDRWLALAAGDTTMTSLAGQLNGLTPVPRREAGLAYDEAVVMQAAMVSERSRTKAAALRISLARSLGIRWRHTSNPFWAAVTASSRSPKPAWATRPRWPTWCSSCARTWPAS